MGGDAPRADATHARGELWADSHNAPCTRLAHAATGATDAAATPRASNLIGRTRCSLPPAICRPSHATRQDSTIAFGCRRDQAAVRARHSALARTLRMLVCTH